MLALLKLQNGTEIIGNVKEEQDTKIVIEDPLQINYRLAASQPMPTVSISRYMPFASEQVISFNKHDLLHVMEPKKAMAEYYTNALHNYKAVIDENVEQELINASQSTKHLQEMEDADEDEITDAYRALLERMNYKGPLN